MNFKSLAKFLILVIIVLGIYFSGQVKPVEEKRMNAALKNVSQWEAVEFNLKGELKGEDTLYHLQVEDGYWSSKAMKGNFALETHLEDSLEKVKGKFIYSNPELYLQFSEDGLPATLEDYLVENYEYSAEEDKKRWVKLKVNPDLELPQRVEEETPEVVSKEEEINEIETYQYQSNFKNRLFTEDLPVNLFLGKKDLNIYRLAIEEKLELDRSFELEKPFRSLERYSTISLDVMMNFSTFDETRDITIPEDYLEL